MYTFRYFYTAASGRPISDIRTYTRIYIYIYYVLDVYYYNNTMDEYNKTLLGFREISRNLQNYSGGAGGQYALCGIYHRAVTLTCQLAWN